MRFMSCCVKSKGLLLHNNSQAVFAEKDRQSQGIILADDKAISQKEQSKAEDSQKMHRRCTEDAQKIQPTRQSIALLFEFIKCNRDHKSLVAKASDKRTES